jgi:hypothetical protein
VSRQASTADPRSDTAQAPHRTQGHLSGRIREEQRHHRSPGPLDAMSTRRSSLRLLAMASPHLAARRKLLIRQQTSGIVRGAYRRSKTLASTRSLHEKRMYKATRLRR